MRPIAELRAAWGSAPRPAIALEDAIEAGALADLRRRFEQAQPRAHWLAHRARCSRATLEPGPIGDRLRALAEAVTGAVLAIRRVEARRFDLGDYALLANDEEAPGFELCLDFSERSGARSGIVYCAGRRPYFVMPQQPGAVVLVQRGPDTRSFMPYLQRFAGAAAPRVYLLRIRLEP
ncbi:MAG TPA: hypothetical protein VML75_25800 [Kofleriaceae bacterium]|nr:hypothetical protein [Kofleriaceae bacterium]